VRLLRHLKKSVSIHAAFNRVYALAEDPGRWQEWYVGASHEEEIPDEEWAGSTRHFRWLSVCAPFPLIQRVVEDRIDSTGAQWTTRSERAGSYADSGPNRAMLIVASNQNWTFAPCNGDAAVTVELDFEFPADIPRHPALCRRIEQLESVCLEQSLENLKRLSEAA
jgi:hypothetical protein